MKLLHVFAYAAAMLAAGNATAQNPAPEKETVIVDFFIHNRIVPAPYAETLREYVLGAFAERGRHNVIDAANSLAGSVPVSGITTPETAEADMSVFLDMRAPQAAAADARYLVSGSIVDYKFEHVQIASGDSKTPPRQGFKATFHWAITSTATSSSRR